MGKAHKEEQTANADRATKEEKDERDIPTMILDWLTGHGFPLEMRTAKALYLAQYQVAQSAYFENAEGVQQEIDIVATRFGAWNDPKPAAFADLAIVAECKANPKNKYPWVVFSADTNPMQRRLAGAYCLLSEIALMAFEQIEAREDITKPDLLTFGSRVGYGIQCAPIYKGPATNEDAAYHAVLKLTHAALSRLTSDSVTAKIVLPVLVVSTPLFECWLDDNGQIKLAERKHLVLAWHRPTRVKASVPFMAVHVVHESGLSEFIQKSDQLFSFYASGLTHEVSTAIAIVHRRTQDEAMRKQQMAFQRDR